jgi:hypothetical protein
MIELKFEDKVRLWRNLRDELETHPQPFKILNDFLSSLPVSSKKVNAFDPDATIQPWNLIDNSSFTEYEIAQLCAYTLQLTDRFSQSNLEIHISKDIKEDRYVYLVYVDKHTVLRYSYKAVAVEDLPNTLVSQKIYTLPPLH